MVAMAGDFGPVTTISLTSEIPAAAKSTSFSRSGVTVSEAAAMSPRPSMRAGRRSSREMGMKVTSTWAPVARFTFSWSSNFLKAS